MTRKAWKITGFIGLGLYLVTGLVIGGLFAFGTNITYWFAAFQVVGWPLWLLATNTDNLWLVTWLPDIFWSTRQ